MPGMIAAARDGNLWFTEPNGMLGRFSPAGLVDEFPAIPTARTSSQREPGHLLTGSP
jgi:streptogramin lyase